MGKDVEGEGSTYPASIVQASGLQHTHCAAMRVPVSCAVPLAIQPALHVASHPLNWI